MNSKQQKLFDSILVCVVIDGWTALALANGAKDAGLTPAQVRVLFPNGVQDIAAAFQDMINQEMQAAIKGNRKFTALRTRDKVAFAVRARLNAAEPHRDALRGLLIWSILPKNIRASTSHVWNAADAIWVAAGDTSTDYNFYTKRVLLVAVMKATLSFWLNDTSAHYQATWDFLDRRINDVLTVGKGIGVVKTVGIGDIASFIKSRLAG